MAEPSFQKVCPGDSCKSDQKTSGGGGVCTLSRSSEADFGVKP